MKNKDVLLIASADGLENCAAMIAKEIGSHVEVAATRKAALSSLRHAEFGVVVVEENMVEGDPEWADRVWESAGLGVALQVNFAISGCARLLREIKGALARREGEQVIARKAAMEEMEDELKSSVQGLLLQTELAMREPTASPALAPKLQQLVDLAGEMRDRLDKRRHRASPGSGVG